MLHMLQWLYTYVASVRSKCFICFFRSILQVCIFGCCICFTHMLQEYVRNVSVVLVLCCNRCFHVASCNCFIWMLHMFQTHVASVCSKYFICFRHMLHSSVSCCKCFVFQRYVQRVMGAWPGRWGKGVVSRGLADGAHDAPGVRRTRRARPHSTNNTDGAFGINLDS